MTKPKEKTTLPATQQKQILKWRNDIWAALESEKVTPLALVKCVKKLLNAEKRVVQYADGERESVMIPDANAVKNGIELAMEMMGLRNAKGFEESDTAVGENQMTVNAVVLVTSDKKSLGWTDGSVCEWLGSEDGVLAVKKKIDDLIKHGDLVDV